MQGEYVLMESGIHWRLFSEQGFQSFALQPHMTTADGTVPVSGFSKTDSSGPPTTPHCKWESCLRDVNSLTLHHTVYIWQSRTLNQDLPVPKPTLPQTLFCSLTTGHCPECFVDPGLLLWVTEASATARPPSQLQCSPRSCCYTPGSPAPTPPPHTCPGRRGHRVKNTQAHRPSPWICETGDVCLHLSPPAG